MSNGNDRPVEDPTYLGHVRYMFEPGDITCMANRSINLQTYDGVRLNAQRIYFHVREGSMPPPSQNRRWPDAKVETFYNWMRNDYPRGIASRVPGPAGEPAAPRVRRDLASYAPDSPELETLKQAFRGLIAREPDDPQSYFALAGLHWLPGPEVYCRHHENAYNPWHRAYLLRFEDALRSVEGCENVTLPYWDIRSNEVPAVLYQDPFEHYEIPRKLVPLDGGDPYPAGSVTEHDPASQILDSIQDRDIHEDIEAALASSHWEKFNGWSDIPFEHTGIIRAHDSGHGACGWYLARQDVAAFDPMFWFFHANWDRLWWRWQQDYGATTLATFKTHLLGESYWLDDPVVNKLEPFGVTSAEMIDSRALGVDYRHPDHEAMPESIAPLTGSVMAAAGFSVPAVDKVSVRVKGINRLEIPGSFDIALRVGDRVIKRKTLFQSRTPKQCATCRKNALANVDFLVDRAALEGGRVNATIELFGASRTAEPFPLSQCGNPTINIRTLIAA